MVEDSRYRTKDYLDTYIDEDNLTYDDDSTLADYAVMYAYPPYPFIMEFIRDERNPTITLNELLFMVNKPQVVALYNLDRTIYGYEESIPIHVYAVDKPSLTAEKILWKAEAELRRVLETYPYGSVRKLSETRPSRIEFGAFLLDGFTLTLSYVRGTT